MGGNGGVKVRATDLLCHVKSEVEVAEYCAAFLQLYREEAHYLERTAPWIERLGLAYVKQRLVEDATGRRNLAERFQESQRYVQIDPWAQMVEQEQEMHRFEPLRELA